MNYCKNHVISTYFKFEIFVPLDFKINCPHIYKAFS